LDLNLATNIISSVVEFTTSDKTIGYFDDSRTPIRNIASFKFTPKSIIPKIGGKVIIVVPIWFKAGRTHYPFTDNTACVSSQLKGTSTKFQRDDDNIEVSFTGITGAETDAITIECNFWRNPITPDIITGFNIYTTDKGDKKIDETITPFSLDASGYIAYQGILEQRDFIINNIDKPV
jgi:hypothetical protein